jgi:hypothetical protein
VVINFIEEVSGQININNINQNTLEAIYQYITLYEYNLNANMVLLHYNMYKGKNNYIATGSSISISENSTSLYNNDWTVLQNS